MRSFERKNSKASLRGGSGGGTGSMDGHHISNRWPVKKAKSPGQKVFSILAGLSLFMQLPYVCLGKKTLPIQSTDGCVRRAPLKKMWIKIIIQEPQKLEDKPIKLSHELMNQLKLYRRRISIWENFWIRDHNYIYMVPSI